MFDTRLFSNSVENIEDRIENDFFFPPSVIQTSYFIVTKIILIKSNHTKLLSKLLVKLDGRTLLPAL